MDIYARYFERAARPATRASRSCSVASVYGIAARTSSARTRAACGGGSRSRAVSSTPDGAVPRRADDRPRSAEPSRHLGSLARAAAGRRADDLADTHYLDEADALCDRVAIVDHGKIVALGSPAELKARCREATRSNSTLAQPVPDDVCRRARELPASARSRARITPSSPRRRRRRTASALAREARATTACRHVRHLNTVTLEDTFIYFTGRSLRDEAPDHGGFAPPRRFT